MCTHTFTIATMNNPDVVYNIMTLGCQFNWRVSLLLVIVYPAMETDLKRERSSDDTSGVTESPVKHRKRTNRYLFCGIYQDSIDDLSGDVFTPLTPLGDKFVEEIKSLGGTKRAEALHAFSIIMATTTTDFHKKELEMALSVIREDVPCFASVKSEEDVRCVGTLKDWREEDYISVIPIFTPYEF